MKLNQKKKPDAKKLAILIGMLLVLFTFGLSLIPRTPTSAATPTPTVKVKKCKFYYKVQPGDTIISIGQLYQIDWRLIAKANNLEEPYVLNPGDRLCIPGGVAPEVVESTGTGKTVTAKVEPSGTVVGGFGHVYIKLEHFPKEKPYNVILRPNNSLVSYKLNCVLRDFPYPMDANDHTQCKSIHTDKNGFFEGWLLIPGYIPRAAIHQLCIKDVWTDETLCTNFNDPEYYLVKADSHSEKFGR